MPSNPSQRSAANLIDAALRAGSFETFLAAAAAVGFDATLREPGPFTLFAPTDAAFAKFPRSTLSKLMQAEHKALLSSIVACHFLFGKVMSSLLLGKRVHASSFSGQDIFISGADAIRVNGARILRPDIQADNGVLHGIDRVLWPKHPAEPGHAPVPQAGSIF